MPQVQVLPAWRASRRDGASPVRDGWQVVEGGEWVQTFKSKREARAAAAEIERAKAPKGVPTMLTQEQLLDLLTTAAQIGRDDESVGRAQTRGDISEIVERRMRDQIAAAMHTDALAGRPTRTEG